MRIMDTAVDVGALKAQVARNCLVVDAHRWGNFSLCGLLLRLRELYKREAGLEPWARVETAAVLPWVGEREAAWAQLEETDPAPLHIGGVTLDPLDEDGVTRLLVPAGWLYVAGQGPGGYPLFVLGEILEHRALDGGVELFVLGRELAHDLVPVPAMCRPGRIVARRAAVRGHLWATLEEAAGAREPGPMTDALADVGAILGAVVGDPEGHITLLEDLAERQIAVAVAHELGELAEDRRRRGAWEALLLRARGTRAEMPARALKDALADAGDDGLFQTLIARRDRVGLALRAAAGPWLLRKILPDARAIGEAARAGRWEDAEALRRAAAERLELKLDGLFSLFDGDPPHTEAARRAEQFESLLLHPQSQLRLAAGGQRDHPHGVHATPVPEIQQLVDAPSYRTLGEIHDLHFAVLEDYLGPVHLDPTFGYLEPELRTAGVAVESKLRPVVLVVERLAVLPHETVARVAAIVSAAVPFNDHHPAAEDDRR